MSDYIACHALLIWPPVRAELVETRPPFDRLRANGLWQGPGERASNVRLPDQKQQRAYNDRLLTENPCPIHSHPSVPPSPCSSLTAVASSLRRLHWSSLRWPCWAS